MKLYNVCKEVDCFPRAFSGLMRRVIKPHLYYNWSMAALSSKIGKPKLFL